ncbi:MAG: helix-turn-helix domain-containing protein, partial [Eubacterium sp.]|nr:helix-turn-helix domain-containing protein [Eubacterium sp.]
LAERALIARLDPARESADLLNAVSLMLDGAGRTRIAELSRRTAVSEKTLERLFLAHTGLSPKSFSSLLRYQLLWRDVLSSPDLSALDAVEKFGYADQAHLLNDFRKRHGMTPREARDYAFKNKF